LRPRFSISQVTTLTHSFDEDVRSYAEAGVDGIGIWEFKLPERDDAETAARAREAGLEVTTCVAAVPSILPLTLMEGPADPRERVDAYCASLRRLATFEPSGVAVLTGSAKGFEPEVARAYVVEGLRRIADEAGGLEMSVGLEPMNRVGGEDWTIVTSIPEALQLLEEADVPELGIVFDVWHLWNTPTLFDDIERHVGRFVGVHVNDWRESTRGWADRVLPGDGVADVPRILGALERAGWTGHYELEIFSDNGTFGNEYPESLWNVPGDECARRGRERFLDCWERRRSASSGDAGPPERGKDDVRARTVHNQHGQATPAQHPAASGVRRRRRRASPGAGDAGEGGGR
jgi:sugar phosphate isomerase/epimerase